MVCFNTMHIDSALARVPSSVSTVYLHVTHAVTLIDHTAASALLEFVDNFQRAGRGVAEIIGLDWLRPRSHAPASMRISPHVLEQERAAAQAALARASMTVVTPEVPDPLAHLERISLTYVKPLADEEPHPLAQALAQAWRYLARQIKAASAFVRARLTGDGVKDIHTERDLAWTSLTRVEGSALPREVERLTLSRSDEPLQPSTTGAGLDDSRWM
jgi:hypothetical protein